MVDGWGDLEGSETDVMTTDDRMWVRCNEDWYCWVDGFAWTCSNLPFPVSACLSKFLPFSSHIRYNCHHPNLQRLSLSVQIRECHLRTTANIYKTMLNSRQSWRSCHHRTGIQVPPPIETIFIFSMIVFLLYSCLLFPLHEGDLIHN